MSKKIIIIGAGIAGLSAGCYARMNGYEAEIYEMHDKPGGLCTSWKRKGYIFDGCLHWLMGSHPGSSMYKLWAELGAVQGRRIYNKDIFYRFNSSDGRALVIYCDVDKLESRHPGFKSSIEVTDVATPVTYFRYTGNWKGTFMTWVISPDKIRKFRMIKKTVPGLGNFWLSGMWVQPPGGVPTGAMTSRAIVQIICRKDKKNFQTSVPVV